MTAPIPAHSPTDPPLLQPVQYGAPQLRRAEGPPNPIGSPTRLAWTADLAAIAMACMLCLIVFGYQFGRGNHQVYLLQPLHLTDPALLANDPWLSKTLQYHIVFNYMTAGLMELGVIQPAFFIMYLALVLIIHAAWLWGCRRLGGSGLTYLLSVLLFYALFGGRGLGKYALLQDNAFVASNVSAVALLVAMFAWMNKRFILAGAAVGVAAMFHLNYAIAGVAMWCILAGWRWLRDGRFDIAVRWGTLLALVPSLANIAYGAFMKLGKGGPLTLQQFVEIYVRFRHPHHYAPLTWPWFEWLAFLLPIPLAIAAYNRLPVSLVRRDAARIVAFILTMLLVVLLFAGVWYVSETLVQMSLWRFAVYAKLLCCIGTAWWWVGSSPRFEQLRPAWHAAMLIGSILVMVLGLSFGKLGFWLPAMTDPPMHQLSLWAKDNTPKDAIFLIPPDEDGFRLTAQRPAVVTFKTVPQLNAELLDWSQRLETVLDEKDLTPLGGNYFISQQKIAARYSTLAPQHLIDAARTYGARYIVARQPMDLPAVFTTTEGQWTIYRLP